MTISFMTEQGRKHLSRKKDLSFQETMETSLCQTIFIFYDFFLLKFYLVKNTFPCLCIFSY
jgi:hypothetical protein